MRLRGSNFRTTSFVEDDKNDAGRLEIRVLCKRIDDNFVSTTSSDDTYSDDSDNDWQHMLSAQGYVNVS